MGIILAVQNVGMKVPIVIRLKGTNVDEAKKLIAASNYKMTVIDDLETAAQKVVAMAKIATIAEESGLKIEFNP
jgi:succinyl-CoA synthetase beta subunit